MKAFIVLLAILLVACASVPAEKLSTLEKGMDRKELIAEFGQPERVTFAYNAYAITYTFGLDAYTLYFDVYDKLYSWEPVTRSYRSAPVSGVVTVNTVN